MIQNIEIAILSSKNTSYYSQLIKYIDKSNLSENERILFDKIWAEAIDFSNWNDSDLSLGCKITHERLRKNFKLSDEAIAKIVRIASYEWK
ncbi:MAG: hypothetical protein IPJ32_14655 [Sphingobacteriaceae bacterium]|nr:hypothetical protein [Sphingobacteriaceae bacterium]